MLNCEDGENRLIRNVDYMFTKLHGVTAHKATIFIATARTDSDP